MILAESTIYCGCTVCQLWLKHFLIKFVIIIQIFLLRLRILMQLKLSWGQKIYLQGFKLQVNLTLKHILLTIIRTGVPRLFDDFYKVKVKLLSRVQLFVTPWTVAYQALPSMGFSGQRYWNGLPYFYTTLKIIEDPKELWLMYGISVYIYFSVIVAQWCPNVCDSINCSLPGSSTHGITRWSIPKSDWLHSLQPQKEKLYTVSKN